MIGKNDPAGERVVGGKREVEGGEVFCECERKGLGRAR